MTAPLTHLAEDERMFYDAVHQWAKDRVDPFPLAWMRKPKWNLPVSGVVRVGDHGY